MTLFLSSFLVLFLEIALIRWMPAYVRLLAYFSNFILLATFLGGGLGCLLANRRRSLTTRFYCRTNGCATVLEIHPEGGIASCPVCASKQRSAKAIGMS